MTKAKRIFVSNRLPFSINQKTGELVRGSGGLVSALLGVSLEDNFAWMGFETDSENIATLKSKAKQIKPNLDLFPVLIDKKLYESYYDKFSNDVLWPLFHYEGQIALFQRAHWQNYVKANQIMADEILKVAGPNDSVWIHDFHFFLLPQMLKDRSPNLRVGFFLHIPFPDAEIFRQLPVRDEILRALVRCDLIGFHEHSYLRHFTVSLNSHLGVYSTVFKAEIGNHILHMGVYPISIDTERLRRKAHSPEVKKQTENYQKVINSEFLIVGVDRLDYTKGIELKLRGFRRALNKYQELRGKVNLLQVAVPTRTKVPSYIRLKKEVDQLIGTINGEFGQPGYTPVQYMFNSLQEKELLALYRRANSVLVTSKRDGMNLVAMEFAIARNLEDPGVLIISEFAGAASLLGHAVIINPWDEDSVADAIYKAYHMPVEERRERLEGLQEILSKYSATQWANSFLNDLESSKLHEKRKPVIRITPHSFTWPQEMVDKIRDAKKIRLVMDYDGTLVGIHKMPGQAILPPETYQLLQRMREKFEILIVSGRSKKFLDEQFPKAPFCIAAEHGAFFKEPGDTWKSRLSSDLNSWFNEVERVMEAYSERVPLSFVERKEASLVWHFRKSPPDFASFQAKKLDDELQVGLANQPVTVMVGNKIIEAKAIECNKGHFLRSLMQSEDEPSLYICIGDDKTDEDMFRVLEDQGISIKVGSEPTAANYRLLAQDEVLLFLKELLEFLSKKVEPQVAL